MGFQLKYATAEERLAAKREQKNRYSQKPYCCPNCKTRSCWATNGNIKEPRNIREV